MRVISYQKGCDLLFLRPITGYHVKDLNAQRHITDTNSFTVSKSSIHTYGSRSVIVSINGFLEQQMRSVCGIHPLYPNANLRSNEANFLL